MALAEWLATYGDADGSRIFPSVASITSHFGWSRRQTFYLLKNLKELLLLDSCGLTSERGTRVRRMNLASFLGAGVQDSREQECKIREQECKIAQHTYRHLIDTKSKSKPKADLPVETVENGGVRNPAAQTAASSPPPLSITENRKLLPQQIEYARVSRLIAGALCVREKANAFGRPYDPTSWKQDLERWAIEREIPFDTDSIQKALDIAERKTPGLAAVAGSRR